MPDSVADRQTIDLKRETLTGDVRDHLLDFIKHEKNVLPFNQMKESQQREVVNRAERFAFDLIERAVEIVASDGRESTKFAVKTVQQTTKGDITVKLESPFGREAWSELGSANTVEVIVTDSKPYQGERRPGGSHVAKDQGNLLDDDGVDEQPVMDQTAAGKKMGKSRKKAKTEEAPAEPQPKPLDGEKLWIEIGDKTKKLMEFEEHSFGDALQRAIKWVGAERQEVNSEFVANYLDIDPLEIPEALRRDPNTNEPAGLKKAEKDRPQGDGGDDGKPDID